jgi:hypothetical protein
MQCSLIASTEYKRVYNVLPSRGAGPISSRFANASLTESWSSPLMYRRVNGPGPLTPPPKGGTWNPWSCCLFTLKPPCQLQDLVKAIKAPFIQAENEIEDHQLLVDPSPGYTTHSQVQWQ